MNKDIQPTGNLSITVFALRLFVGSALVIGSLMSFPSVATGMIAIWLMWHSLATYSGRPATWQLWLCLVIVLVKRLDWTLAMIVFGIVTFGVAIAQFRCRKKGQSSTRAAIVGTLLLWSAFLYLAMDRQFAATAGHPRPFDSTKPILCIGDSLSSGTSPGTAYAEYLEKHITAPVIDLSVPGITAEEGLAIVTDWFKNNPDEKPQTIVVELGGHDFLRQRTRQATIDKLTKIVKLGRHHNMDVVLMEIPRGFIVDNFKEIERKVVRQHDLQLISDTPLRSLVLWSPNAPPGMWFSEKFHLSEDGLHPNRRGAKQIAQSVTATLVKMYGSDVKK